MGLTSIEWCDLTFNPWWGCAEVSPACAHCYARVLAHRWKGPGLWPEKGKPGQQHDFHFASDQMWRLPLRWAKRWPKLLGRRPRVFCASMADVFEDRPELHGPRGRLLDLIAATPELDWLLLTKRPEFAELTLRFLYVTDGEWRLPPNLWLGVSIENARFTYRADVLREIPAAVRFISAEPLLDSLFIGGGESGVADQGNQARGDRRAPLNLTDIDWLIIGGESGPKARPFHLEHARELIFAADAETRRRGIDRPVATFVKQLGALPVYDDDLTIGVYKRKTLKLHDRKGGDWSEWPSDLRIREFPRSVAA